MFCKNCGKQIPDNAVVCVACGTEIQRPPMEDTASCGWWWLGFFVPVAGLLIWALCTDSQPKRAKKAGIGAIVGTIVFVVLTVLFYVLWMAFIFMLATM